MTSETISDLSETSVRWQPLPAIERRLLGVLVEKAKTTPENYPLSLNALRTGSSQKSNRAPQMDLEEEQVEEGLDALRAVGAVTEIQGSGRVDKYRHLAYDWFGVDKVELAVMAELLLRGSQTVGELRGRAARMEPIKDLSELRPILDGLKEKGLVLFLTPPGRGCVVTHALFGPQELEKIRRELGNSSGGDLANRSTAPSARSQTTQSTSESTTAPAIGGVGNQNDTETLAAEVQSLRDEVAGLRQELAELRGRLGD